jgi:putative alpha-1,2-mannosidase
VLLMPYSGETKLEPGYPERPFSGYRSRFKHQDERAEPGYYAVKLLDNDVDVELTASERVGLHRYRYAAGAPKPRSSSTCAAASTTTRQEPVVAPARARRHS